MFFTALFFLSMQFSTNLIGYSTDSNTQIIDPLLDQNQQEKSVKDSIHSYNKSKYKNGFIYIDITPETYQAQIERYASYSPDVKILRYKGHLISEDTNLQNLCVDLIGSYHMHSSATRSKALYEIRKKHILDIFRDKTLYTCSGKNESDSPTFEYKRKRCLTKHQHKSFNKSRILSYFECREPNEKELNQRAEINYNLKMDLKVKKLLESANHSDSNDINIRRLFYPELKYRALSYLIGKNYKLNKKELRLRLLADGVRRETDVRLIGILTTYGYLVSYDRIHAVDNIWQEKAIVRSCELGRRIRSKSKDLHWDDEILLIDSQETYDNWLAYIDYKDAHSFSEFLELVNQKEDM